MSKYLFVRTGKLYGTPGYGGYDAYNCDCDVYSTKTLKGLILNMMKISGYDAAPEPHLIFTEAEMKPARARAAKFRATRKIEIKKGKATGELKRKWKQEKKLQKKRYL